MLLRRFLWGCFQTAKGEKLVLGEWSELEYVEASSLIKVVYDFHCSIVRSCRKMRFLSIPTISIAIFTDYSNDWLVNLLHINSISHALLLWWPSPFHWFVSFLLDFSGWLIFSSDYKMGIYLLSTIVLNNLFSFLDILLVKGSSWYSVWLCFCYILLLMPPSQRVLFEQFYKKAVALGAKKVDFVLVSQHRERS